ncbi:MAG: alginate export family protein [Sphingopyxis sp.]|nr:alginate export family protein [Sphingopyxis sp.]
MTKIWISVPLALLSATACAQEMTVKPLLDARLRYEATEQDGLPRDADALTLRVRPGVQLTKGRWSALVEAEANLAIAYDYNDGANGKAAFPLIADPPNLEFNRAQIRYADEHGLALTAGRQRIELADQRFVGSAGFRQNEQSYDAVRLQYGTPQGLSADLAYSWSVRTVNGRNGTGARPQAIGGNNVFAVVSYGTGIGTLSAFTYMVDQDEAAVQAYRLSSQTWGLRLAGSQPIGKDLKLSYTASWARQSDWRRNPNDYSAGYWLAEAGIAAGGLTATGGYEVLGAGDGTPLTSVQTPLASHFRFNGWAGKFVTTPPGGLRDLYATLGYGRKKTLGLDAVSFTCVWHRFDSDRLGQHYGDELGVALTAKRGRTGGSVRYARYRADAFATDTDRLWLTLDYAI